MEKDELLEAKRILIVDDEPDILDTLEELLSMCSVMRAENFEDAKKLIASENIDIAILDIMGVNGYELLNIATKKNIIAVMLTAHALSPGNVVKSYKEGAAFYIPKEKIGNIEIFLNDVLEAKAKGKNSWWRWYDRLATYFEERFGPDWQKEDEDFWKKYLYY